ncbi:MAG: FAD binding domain-containing protein [Planctomycetota bacterium]|jgi:carbon-monoxide dehydrogenase medium subunit
MDPFEYHHPSSVKEALSLIKKGRGRMKPLAGGTDLMVQRKTGRREIRGVVDLKGIPELSGFKQMKSGVAIGPCTTLAEILSSSLVKRRLPVLAAVARQMGSPQVRNRATIGGNLANAAPSADMAPPLMALDARVQVIGQKGRKTHSLASFFKGPGTTLLGEDKLLGTITVPFPKRGTFIAYHPLTLREAMDISIASAAVAVRREKGRVKHARIILGAVGPVPMDVCAAADILLGTPGGSEDISAAAKKAAKSARPITDQRGSKAYRRDMVEVLVERALTEVLS